MFGLPVITAERFAEWFRDRLGCHDCGLWFWKDCDRFVHARFAV